MVANVYDIMMMMVMMTIIRAEGEALAKEWGENVLFLETSAKADINVKEVIFMCSFEGGDDVDHSCDRGNDQKTCDDPGV